MLAPPPVGGCEKNHPLQRLRGRGDAIGRAIASPQSIHEWFREKHLAGQQTDWLPRVAQGWQSVSGPVKAPEVSKPWIFKTGYPVA